MTFSTRLTLRVADEYLDGRPVYGSPEVRTPAAIRQRLARLRETGCDYAWTVTDSDGKDAKDALVSYWADCDYIAASAR
jgi:hypothetical protein